MSARETKRVSKKIATPEVMLAAAEAAPSVFHIGAYFQPIYIMRKKGHSWRSLAEWLQQFNIEISHVHLRRLYVQEDKRISKLTKKELWKMGMPRDMIEGYLEKDDPTSRLPAPDPDADESESETVP